MVAKFEVPVPAPQKHGKDLTAATQKEYRRLLNHIAAEGFTTPTAILEHKFGVLKVIKERSVNDDDEKQKHSHRAYISAVLWVLPEAYKNSKKFNPFKALFQQSLPETNFATGEAWKPRNKYHA